MGIFQPKVDGYVQDIGHQFLAKQLREAEKYLGEGQAFKASLADPEEVRKYAQRQREYFLGAIGGLPGDRCDLNPQITDTIAGSGYKVEKIIFESLPGLYVTANLYLPDTIKGKTPAVLVACGHAREAKAYPSYHSYAAMLAKNGLIAFAVDPVGQGERLQMIDRATGAQIVNWGTREHSYIGLACTLLGQNITRYFIWDLMRAIDYLQTRREVDSTKIGCSGSSGGGTQTSQLILLDDRIAAAAPSCYITERLCYMKSFDAHDAEQNYFGHISARFNYDDFLIAFAPKPLLLLGVSYDFFPVEGLRQAYEETRRIYSLFDAEDNCRLCVDEANHALTPASQRTGVKFFSEVLAGKKLKAVAEPEKDEIITPEELQCTQTGQVLMDYPKVPSLMERIVAEIPSKKTDADQIIKRVKSLVWDGVEKRQKSDLQPKIISSEVDVRDFRIEKLFFNSEPDITLAGVYIKPAQCTGKIPVTVVVAPDATASLTDSFTMTRLKKLWVGGKGILFLDLRASGAIAPEGSPDEINAIYGPVFTLAYNAWMFGDNLVCQRAFDVLRGVEYLRSRHDVDPKQISVCGEADMAAPALLAAVADDKIKNTEFTGLAESYREELQKIFYDRKILNEWTAIHGMLTEFDIPDLLAILEDRGQLI